MFAKLKTLALTIAGAALALAAIFTFGQRSGKKTAQHHETKRRLKSTEDMKKIHGNIESEDDPHLIKTLNRFKKGSDR